VQRPHIPLWLGGGGEQVTLKLVAKWGDACNVGGGRVDVVKQKLDVLRQHCETVGRDYNTITRSTNMTVFLLEDGADAERVTAKVRGQTSFEQYKKDAFVMTAKEMTDHIHQLIDTGIDYVITYFPRVAYDQGMLQRFASDVMPKFK